LIFFYVVGILLFSLGLKQEFVSMSYFRWARDACSPGGRVADLVAASKASIDSFNPFVSEDWQGFAVIAFQSRNWDVLEYILCRVSAPLELLTHIQDLCRDWDKHANELIQKWIADLPDLIRKNIHRIAGAVDEYNENNSYIRSLLIANPSFCTYAIEEAMENYNPAMLNDAFQVYGCVTALREIILRIARAVDKYIEKNYYLRSLLFANPAVRTFAIAKAIETCNPLMLKDALQVYGNYSILYIEQHQELYKRLMSTLAGFQRYRTGKNIPEIEAILRENFRSTTTRTRTPTPKPVTH